MCGPAWERPTLGVLENAPSDLLTCRLTVKTKADADLVSVVTTCLATKGTLVVPLSPAVGEIEKDHRVGDIVNGE